jgi:hypothetical protein
MVAEVIVREENMQARFSAAQQPFEQLAGKY